MKILVIDDEHFICELLDEFLTLKGHEVEVGGDGETAVRLYRELQPDMVLLDIRMAGMSGIEALQQIRQIDDRAGIVMLSAFGDEETVDEALASGADYYIQKPMVLDNLLTIIGNWQSRIEDGAGK
jgi:DNA-binding response OmpR family regulator